MSQIQIPKGWEIKELGNKEYFLDIIGGGTPSRKNSSYYGGNIPWVRLGDMKVKYLENTSERLTADGLKKLGDRMIPKGAVILSTRATIGAVAISKVDLCTNQGFKSIVCNEEKILPEYLYYFFKSIKQFLITKGNTTTFPEVNKTTLMSITVPVPPTKIQKKIVQKLDYILGQLEEKKISIYKILNIQKKRIVNISNNFEIFLFNEIINEKQKYQKKLWKSVKLSEITFKITKGIFDLSPSNYSTHGIPFLRISDIQRNEINFSNVKFIPESIHKKHIGTSIGAGDLVLAKVGASAGSPEKIAIIPKNIVQVNLSQNLIGISINKKIISSEYLLNYLKFKLMDQIIAGSKTTTFKSIGLAVLRNVSINLPPLNVQNELLKEFNDKKRLVSANQIETLIEKNESIKKYLIKLQNSVLDKAFSGKLVN